VKKYYVDEEKAMAVAEIKQFVESQEGVTQSDALKVYFATEAQTKVLETYNSKVTDDMSFLWIKNIWVTDASYKHPVLTYSEFQQEVSREKFEIAGEKYTLTDVKQYTNAYEEHVYQEITGKLTVQQKQANGYFILIALSIGTILLQQFVTMRSQKEQQKYSTVDGQGASQQKTTMIMMTVMFAIFSFMYSSAFAIYLIMSNLLSLVSTVVINKFVDKSQEKKNKVHETSISGRYASTLKTKDKKDKK
jgi:membrane protein insertase Oxa1/YidC/SpoIIIJ